MPPDEWQQLPTLSSNKLSGTLTPPKPVNIGGLDANYNLLPALLLNPATSSKMPHHVSNFYHSCLDQILRLCVLGCECNAPSNIPKRNSPTENGPPLITSLGPGDVHLKGNKQGMPILHMVKTLSSLVITLSHPPMHLHTCVTPLPACAPHAHPVIHTSYLVTHPYHHLLAHLTQCTQASGPSCCSFLSHSSHPLTMLLNFTFSSLDISIPVT
jgi:hypothetical protein